MRNWMPSLWGDEDCVPNPAFVKTHKQKLRNSKKKNKLLVI